MSQARLLIADDEPANLAIMVQILEPSYALLYARSGSDAIALAKRHHPDLVLLDIQMPDLDGYSVCRTLKANADTEFIPVIFVTTLSELGHEILSHSEAPVFKIAAEIAYCHHENWDGSGYPRGLVGEAIPESARIVAVADVFDALTMKRPYKEAWPIEHAIDIMSDLRGSKFEPRLFDGFAEILPRIRAIKAEWDQRGE